MVASVVGLGSVVRTIVNPAPLGRWQCILGCNVCEYLCYKAFVRLGCLGLGCGNAFRQPNLVGILA